MVRGFRRIKYNSPVILTFTLLALGVLMLGDATKGLTTKLFFTNFRTSFLDPLQYLRLFSHVLGHVNWQHFYGNFIIILLVGPMLEEKYGSKTLLQMILITAFITGLTNTLFFNQGLLGASGIAFMFIILSSFVNVEKGRLPITLVIVFLIFVGKEVFEGLTLTDNISHFSHIVGGIFGVIFAYKVQRKREKMEDIY